MEPPPSPKPSRWRRLRGLHHASKPTVASPSSSPQTGAVLRKGFLLKKGHRMPTTKERFFELRPQLLSYFRTKQHASDAPSSSSSSSSTKPDARQLRGVLELTPGDLITPLATSRHWFLIQKLHGPDGKPYKLELRATSPEERQEWIDALRAAARDPHATAARAARDAERERQLTRTFTMLRVRDATLLSTVVRQHAPATQGGGRLSRAGSFVVDLRASFQVFHELVLLQSLVTQITTEWGPPASWTCEQYDTLVESIALTDHQTFSASSSSSPHGHDENDTSVLTVARRLQYAFEEVPENQQKLLARRERRQSLGGDSALPSLTQVSLHGSFMGGATSSTTAGRVRCPTIYSYLSTFERLAPSDSVQRFSDDSERSSSISSAGTASARASLNGNAADGAPLSPRSATLAKYAHMYLEEEGKHHKPWRWDRVSGDDSFDHDDPLEEASIAQYLADRFERDKIYTYVRHHTLLFVNPNRVLKTNKFTSIYDEQVVLAYAQTPFAHTQLAPHPFAMAKQALFRLFFAARSSSSRLSMVLSGDSGSGKTELAKELLKYAVLTAQPTPGTAPSRTGKVVLYTSSTKSTFQMRNEETRTLDLLHAKGITDYEVVLLDLTPEKWSAMTSVSKSKRLPQVHVDGLFFGFYETLQRLEDEEQLRMYFCNPHAAKKLSSVLDSNILLEAFAHAATPLNSNSSRYAKRVEIYVAYGRDPAQYQVLGCAIAPFLLEKSRVTSVSRQRNFHVLYALVHGLNAGDATPQSVALMAKKLHLDGCSSRTFRYTAGHDATLSEREAEWTRKKDAERFHNIVMAMETVGMVAAQQEAIFQVLSAVLWLGNLDFEPSVKSGDVIVSGNASGSRKPIATVVEELLELESGDALLSLVLQRRVEMASTGETFDVQLSVNQARFARDTLARFLYDMVFHYVVAQLNHATRCPADSIPQTHTLALVDMFGFENFVSSDSGSRNSLEQLCINYLTEKLAAAELQLVAMRYATTPSVEIQEEPVLHLFEHPLGLFATLDEQTVLHQSEGDAALADDQKKNQLFVRYLYQRNHSKLLAQPSQLKQHQLQFLVPHARDLVTYDAQDFVKKNSDFLPAKLLQILETTQNTIVQEMAIAMRQKPVSGAVTRGDGASRASTTNPSSGSLTAQFRQQIQYQVGLLENPLFLHCFRANSSSAWTSATHVDPEMLQKQVRAHRIAPIVARSRGHDDDASAYEMTISTELFHSRFKCLAASDDASASLCATLEEKLRRSLDLSDDRHAILVEDASGGLVRVRTLQIAETLELLLAKRQFEAVTRLQATFRMVRTRTWYRALQADRRELTQELLELYGPNSTRKIERTLRKYEGGRERELRTKIAAKKQDKAAIAELSKGMEVFMAYGTGVGGLDPQLLDEVLRDREIQRQIAASENRIVVALREMSLNPHHVLPRQLADPELRAFYQRMLGLLQLSMNKQHQQQTPAVEDLAGDQLDGEAHSLEDRVRLLVTRHKAVWKEVARVASEPWRGIQDRLDEIGDEPEMLLFYSDEDAFVETFSWFVAAVERRVKDASGSPTTTDQDDATDSLEDLLQQLKQVEFSATLMAAMQGDPFFVEALQSPAIVAAVHQLVTDREAFAATQRDVRLPLWSEFFHRLVRLSEETRKHH